MKVFTFCPLNAIAGIGPARKRALQHAFGTAKAIARASLGDLDKVAGVNAVKKFHSVAVSPSASFRALAIIARAARSSGSSLATSRDVGVASS